MAYTPGKLTAEAWNELARPNRIGVREARAWYGVVGFDDGKIINRDGSIRNAAAADFIPAESVTVDGKIVRLTFADGSAVEIFKPWWIA